MVTMFQTDIRSVASAFRHLNLSPSLSRRAVDAYRLPPRALSAPSSLGLKATVRAFSAAESEVEKLSNKPPICTADELHYVSVSSSDWRLALWRYKPCPQAPPRNHPLLLLSGVGTNAIGYDLSPGSSFARYMCGQGFDTWILEVRGAGLSMQRSDSKEIEQSAHAISDQMEEAAKTATNGVFNAQQQSISSSRSSAESEISIAKRDPTEKLAGFLNEGQSSVMSAKLFDQISRLLEDSFLYERFNEIRAKLASLLESRENSAVTGQIRYLSQKLVNIIDEGQRSVSPQLFDLQEHFLTTIEDFQKQLEEDVPAVMDYIRDQTKPKDGKLLAIGHSMGGILLYALLSRCGFEGRDPGLVAVVTLASSLDYTSSKSSLKLLLPLADPAQALHMPVPLRALLGAAYPLSSSPPYVLSWLNHLISAEDMMHPELLKKLVLNNFWRRWEPRFPRGVKYSHKPDQSDS